MCKLPVGSVLVALCLLVAVTATAHADDPPGPIRTYTGQRLSGDHPEWQPVRDVSSLPLIFASGSPLPFALEAITLNDGRLNIRGNVNGGGNWKAEILPKRSKPFPVEDPVKLVTVLLAAEQILDRPHPTNGNQNWRNAVVAAVTKPDKICGVADVFDPTRRANVYVATCGTNVPPGDLEARALAAVFSLTLKP
jgi:hypothetical protein